MRDDYLKANGLRFHYIEEGPADGPPVLLLHGFPEFSYSWRAQLPALAAAGFRAVAPDMRGYNLSDRPKSVAAYSIDELASDVAGMIDALGAQRVRLVGHDWGGAVAWHTAMHHSERVERLAVLACPPAAELARAILTDWRQARRSYYIFLFQIPGVAERLLSGDRFRRVLRRIGRGVFSDEDLDRYMEAFATPGAMRAALNYYRAAFRGLAFARRNDARRVTAPTLVLWGERDGALGVRLTHRLDRYVAAPLTVEVLRGVGHFFHQETPEAVNQRLLDFFR
jgi:pimeloyl-ACP methyl ester carboxylesterase